MKMTGNDFEKIAFEKNNKLKEIFKFLETIEIQYFLECQKRKLLFFSI